MPVDYLYGLLGGVMIGTAAAVYLLVSGRVMGASGVLGALVDGSAGRDWAERLALVAGLVLVPGAVVWMRGGAETHLTGTLWVVVVAGLLVGIGTRLANGCTSGHGVCGISRLSARGIAATLVYLAAGGLSVVAFRHILGLI